MQKHSLSVLSAAVFVVIAHVAPAGAVSAAEQGSYVEGSVGFTRSVKQQAGGLTAEPGTDLALGATLGRALSETSLVEVEVAYGKMAWDLGSGIDLTADGFTASGNFLYVLGGTSSAAKLEVGVGLGWTFFDEACLESSGSEICVDTDFDDWNVQGIVGGSYALSETGAIVLRYRMQHIGGFSSEERLHVFTVGYRHHF